MPSPSEVVLPSQGWFTFTNSEVTNKANAGPTDSITVGSEVNDGIGTRGFVRQCAPVVICTGLFSAPDTWTCIQEATGFLFGLLSMVVLGFLRISGDMCVDQELLELSVFFRSLVLGMLTT